MKPLISVIITTYNSASTIERLLQSIVYQEENGTTFEVEILIADDCSRDNTIDIVKQFDVSLIENEQNSGGPNLGRNKLLELARGTYITFADHDDEWQPNKISTYLNYTEKATIISSGYRILNEVNQNKRDVVNKFQNGYKTFSNNETFIALLQKNYEFQITYLGTLFFPASLKDIRFETMFGKADYDYQIRLFQNQSSLEIGEVLHNRHIMGSNLSLQESYRNEDVEITLKELSKYEQNYPLEVALGKQRTYGTLARYYYSIGEMQHARTYFKKADFSWKTVMYYLTTYIGSSYVNKWFKVFG